MKKNYSLLIFISCILCFACNSQNRKDVQQHKQEVKSLNNLIIMKKEYIDKFFNLPETKKRSGGYKLNEQDINDQIAFFKEGLTTRGYNFPDDSTFSEKIGKVFQIENITQNPDIIVHSNFFIGIPHDEFYNLYTERETTIEDRIKFNESVQYEEEVFIVFVKNSGFIMPVMSPVGFIKIENNEYILDIPDYVFHRNNYLFNDKKSSLTWLINNDKYFVMQLVTNYAYDTEPKINELLLSYKFQEYANAQPYSVLGLENVFVRKKWNRELLINKNLLKYISDNTTLGEDKYMRLLDDYAYTLHDKDSEWHVHLTWKFTREEVYKIIAHIGYYEELARKKNNIKNYWSSASLLWNGMVRDKELLQIIKDNNYYNLSDFEELIEELLSWKAETEIDLQ